MLKCNVVSIAIVFAIAVAAVDLICDAIVVTPRTEEMVDLSDKLLLDRCFQMTRTLSYQGGQKAI